MIFYVLVLSFVLYYTISFLYTLPKRQKYYQSQGLYGPARVPIFDNVLQILFRPFIDYEASNFKNYGRTFVDYIQDTNGVINTSDPEIVKKILIKDFNNFSHRVQAFYNPPFAGKAAMFRNGAEWRRVRTQVTPVFSSGKLKTMYKNFEFPIQTTVNNIDELISQNKGEQIDTMGLMRAFALDVIGNVVFSLKTNNFKDDHLRKKIASLFLTGKIELLLFNILPKPLAQLFKSSFLNSNFIEYFSKMALSIIENRKKNPGVVYNDFVEMLLKAEVEGVSDVKANVNENGYINKELTTEEVVGQCFIFFMAGTETVSTALASLFYELACHPAIQDKLYDDLVACYPDDEVAYDDINKSNYLDCVLNESLRKHTAVSRVFRTALTDYDFGKFKVKKGQSIGVSVYNMHNDPDLWVKPDEFRPERFQNGEACLDAFLPFLDGPRMCLGNRFSLIEMKLLIIRLVKNYRVFTTDKTTLPMKQQNIVVLNVVDDLKLGFEKRN